jgi:hypothetical protein
MVNELFQFKNRSANIVVSLYAPNFSARKFVKKLNNPEITGL